MWKRLMDERGLRCCCDWDRGQRRDQRRTEAELVQRQVERAVARARADRDVTVRRKSDCERGSVGGGDGGQSGEDGVARENRDGVIGDDVGTDEFAADVADASGGGACNDAREIAALAYMASGDKVTRSRVITLDSLSDGVQAMKWVVGHLEIQRGEDGTIGGGMTIGGGTRDGRLGH